MAPEKDAELEFSIAWCCQASFMNNQHAAVTFHIWHEADLPCNIILGVSTEAVPDSAICNAHIDAKVPSFGA